MAGYVFGALDPRRSGTFRATSDPAFPCLYLDEEYMAVGTKLADSSSSIKAPASLRIRTLETFTQEPVNRARRVAQIHYRRLSGVSCLSVSGTRQRGRKRWTTKQELPV